MNMAPDLKKQLSHYLWVEKYRPTSIEDMILPKSYKDFFMKIIKDKEIPNLLLYSSTPGSGKTTLAKAICYDLDATYRYINISSQGGIDTLRNDIKKFASMKTLDGKPKIVICDESDGASPQFQAAMRATIEQFSTSCRFIFTCNFITKIIDPLKSRCQPFDFNMTENSIAQEIKPDIISRLSGILEFEEVEYKQETVNKIVETYFPDIRKMIYVCQKYAKMNNCIDENIFTFDNVDDEFYGFILEKKFRKAREYLIQKNYNYSELFRELFDNLIPRIESPKQGQIILIIGEYMHRHATAIDPEINAACCLYEIMANI